MQHPIDHESGQRRPDFTRMASDAPVSRSQRRTELFHTEVSQGFSGVGDLFVRIERNLHQINRLGPSGRYQPDSIFLFELQQKDRSSVPLFRETIDDIGLCRLSCPADHGRQIHRQIHCHSRSLNP